MKKIKELFNEQEKEIEALNKQISEMQETAKSAEKEMTVVRIEYTKQVKENEATVKRYRKLMEEDKKFAITKFAKDLLEVRDAIRFALENSDRDACMAEEDMEKLKERFAANLDGQQMTADVMDRVLERFDLS